VTLNRTEELAREIIQYFLRNRFAADDLEGIVRWRLRTERIDENVEATLRALELLVAKGFLQTPTPSTAAGPVFSLNPQKVDEAERFLSQE
jgi:hypothetical protein